MIKKLKLLTQVNDLIDIGIALIQLDISQEALFFSVDLFPKITQETINNYYRSYGMDLNEEKCLIEPFLDILKDALYKNGKWGFKIEDNYL